MMAFSLNDKQKQAYLDLRTAAKTDPSKMKQVRQIENFVRKKMQESKNTQPIGVSAFSGQSAPIGQTNKGQNYDTMLDKAGIVVGHKTPVGQSTSQSSPQLQQKSGFDMNVERPDLGVSGGVGAKFRDKGTQGQDSMQQMGNIGSPDIVYGSAPVNAGRPLPEKVIKNRGRVPLEKQAETIAALKARGFDVSSLNSQVQEGQMGFQTQQHRSSEKEIMDRANQQGQTGVEEIDKQQDFITARADDQIDQADRFFQMQQNEFLEPARAAVSKLEGQFADIGNRRIEQLNQTFEESRKLIEQMRQEATQIFDMNKVRNEQAMRQMGADQGFTQGSRGAAIARQMVADFNNKMDQARLELQQKATERQLDAVKEYQNAMDQILTQENLDAQTINAQIQQLQSAYSGVINGYQNSVDTVTKRMTNQMLGNMAKVAELDFQDRVARRQAMTEFNIKQDELDRAKTSELARRELIMSRTPDELKPFMEGIIAEGMRRGDFMTRDPLEQISSYIKFAHSKMLQQENDLIKQKQGQFGRGTGGRTGGSYLVGTGGDSGGKSTPTSSFQSSGTSLGTDSKGTDSNSSSSVNEPKPGVPVIKDGKSYMPAFDSQGNHIGYSLTNPDGSISYFGASFQPIDVDGVNDKEGLDKKGSDKKGLFSSIGLGSVKLRPGAFGGIFDKKGKSKDSSTFDNVSDGLDTKTLLASISSVDNPTANDLLKIDAAGFVPVYDSGKLIGYKRKGFNGFYNKNFKLLNVGDD